MKRPGPKRILLAALVVIAPAIAGIEISTRLFGVEIPHFDWERDVLIAHDQLKWVGRPGAERWLENGDYDVFVAHDELGFRLADPLPRSDASHRILIVGSSTAWGMGVGQGQLLSDWLQRGLPQGSAVDNRAVLQHGLRQIEGMLRNALAASAYDDVILLLSASELQIDPPPLSGLSAWNELRARAAQTSRVVSFLGRHWERLQIDAGPGPSGAADPPGAESLASAVERMRRACNDRGARLIVAYAPGASEIFEGEVSRARLLLERAAREAGARFFDPIEALRNAPQQIEAHRGAPPPVETLFHTKLGTWTHRAHLIAAEALLDSGLLSVAWTPGAEDGEWRRVPPEHSYIRYEGRVDLSRPGEVRFDWPSVAIHVRLRSDRVRFALRSEVRRNYFNVRVDGKLTGVWTTNREERSFELNDLGAGVHDVEIRKRSDIPLPVAFTGLELPAGAELLPSAPARTRKLEVLGASYATGHGNEGRLRGYENRGNRVRRCADNGRLTDTNQSFGAVLARELDAELHLNALTGKGLIRNHGDLGASSELAFIDYFQRRLSSEPGTWDFSSWIPDVVILDIGENDFDSEIQLDEQGFALTYSRLVEEIRGHYPEAFILLLTEARFLRLGEIAEELVDERRSAGDTRIDRDTFAKPERGAEGCMWHPTFDYHRQLAERLARRLEPELGTPAEGKSRSSIAWRTDSREITRRAEPKPAAGSPTHPPRSPVATGPPLHGSRSTGRPSSADRRRP